MKMKVIDITEKNIKDIYGRLRKFFYNNKKTGFEEWHNFDCGFKKHIDRKIHIDNNKIEVVNQYTSPIEMECVGEENEKYIRILLSGTDGLVLHIGDKIAFCGNHIIIREKWSLNSHNYIYSVFQAKPMSKELQDSLRRQAEIERAEYEADVLEMTYEDYCLDF